MNGAHDNCRDCGHWSVCAPNNEPAFPAGPCDGNCEARLGLIGGGAPGLALIHAGDLCVSHAQIDLTAILPAHTGRRPPVPWMAPPSACHSPWSTRTGGAPS